MTSKSRLKLALETIAKDEEITPELLNLLNKEEKHLVETVFIQGSIVDTLNFLENIDVDSDWKSLEKQLVKHEATLKTPVWKSAMRYAALFVGVFALGYAVQYKRDVNVETQVSEIDGIKLLLGNDQIKILAQDNIEDIVVSGEVVAYSHGNKIKYTNQPQFDELIFHQIVIPYGKIFDIELADGTVVHLNSGSKMRYPVSFKPGQPREVFIEGEAYFEVSEDKKHPFVVNADAVSIEVLGTKFSLSTYNEDPEINAVLVEGSISMTNSYFPKDAITLTPGTKGSWDKTKHNTTIESVDTKNYISWMHGELVFRNTSFENMAKKLERKYNVEIKNNNSVLAKKSFNASFNDSFESIEDVLKNIAELYPFQYEVFEHHILIY